MSKRFRQTALACAMACGLGLPAAAQTLRPTAALTSTSMASGAAATSVPAGATSGIYLSPPGGLPNSGQMDPAELKVYEVPSELIGAVGARLQITYHGHPRVRVATEPKTGQLMVMAPESIQRDIAGKMQMLIWEAQKSGVVPDDRGMSVASTKQQAYALRNLRPQDLENALQRLAGPRLTATTERNGEVATFRLASTTGMQDVMQIDRTNGQVLLLGGGPSVAGWMQIVYALDMGQSDPFRATHVMPLAPADPQRVRQAVQLVRAVFQQRSDDQEVTAQVPAGGQIRPNGQAGDVQNPDEPAMAIGSAETLGAETGLFGDVQIEFIEDLDLVIIKGAKRDVQRTLEVIEQIKKKSAETQPEITVMRLKHVDSTAVATLINELYEDVLKPRQGTVSITPLGQPQALLLIGRKEAVQSVVELINKLDQPLDASDQLRVFRLLHASAVDAETTIRDFFTETPGSGDDLRTGLGTRVKLIADYRTNSLIVQAAPRDLAEVAKLVEQLDVEGTPAQNEVRIFRLKNAIAEDLTTVLTSIITGEAPEGGGGGGGGGEATPPSTKLSIIQRAARVDSGILAGVVITADPSQNALVVRAPSKSMALIAQLIEQLDQLPGVEAQIKVFEVKNGDATALAVTLQQLFGLPVTAGQNPGGGVFGANAQLQLAGLTAGGEGSLVQLRVTVDTRTNSIIVSGSASDLEVIEVLLLRLDEKGVETRTTEVFWLRNANAADVANALTQFLNTQRTVIQQQLLLNQAISIFEQVDREVFVVAEQTTNSLIVSATPRYIDTIRNVITKLDRRPPLVAIQVLMAEVTLGDQFEWGVELGLQDSLLFDRNSVTGGTVSSPVFNQGTVLTNSVTRGQTQNVAGQGMSTFGLGRAGSLSYGGLVLSAASESVGILVRALQDANRLQILSRPQIMTMDNRPASTLVGQNVPRVSGTVQGFNGSQVNVVPTNVGLSLQVWPRVNEDGLIVMQVIVERSSLGPEATGIPVGFGSNGQVIRSPVINTTNAQTTISAYSGQTVVFAGLIQKTRSSVSRRIPYLADIPYLGALFRFDVEAEQRNELLVVLTPRIVQTDEDYEIIKQVESSRMSYCLADILEMHGDVGLTGGHGLWGPARGPIIYPDLQPAAIDEIGPDGSIMDMQFSPELAPAIPGGACPPGTEIMPGQGLPGGSFAPDGTPYPSGNIVPAQPYPQGQPGELQPAPQAAPQPAPTVQAAPALQPVSYERPVTLAPARSTAPADDMLGMPRGIASTGAAYAPQPTGGQRPMPAAATSLTPPPTGVPARPNYAPAATARPSTLYAPTGAR